MLSSMTGYGRSELEDSSGAYASEIQCLNKRHLDVSVQLPRALLFLESKIKDWVRERLHRGLVHVNFYISSSTRASLSVTPHISLIAAYKKAWDEVNDKLKLESPFPLDAFATNRDFFSCNDALTDEEKELVEPLMKKVLNSTLDQVVYMRRGEGVKILKDLLSFLKEIENCLKDIPSFIEESKLKWLARLEKSMEGLVQDLGDTHQDRALRELAILAEKMDVSEEIQRLGYHIESTKELLESKEAEAKGKRLEFMLQEMNREVNTLSAKSSHREIASRTIEMKSLLEKFREQVQNVE